METNTVHVGTLLLYMIFVMHLQQLSATECAHMEKGEIQGRQEAKCRFFVVNI